jgi:hypothetical protein
MAAHDFLHHLHALKVSPPERLMVSNTQTILYQNERKETSYLTM